jgi:rfaE bifunctional protein kinase chain/domain
MIQIAATLKKFVGKKILVVGDVMLDAYLWGTVDRISPEAPVPVVAIDRSEERLGGAANVALNLRELGAAPILCSVIGHDDAGKLLLKHLKRNNISAKGIITSARRITTVKTRVLSKSHQLIRYDAEITGELEKEEEKKLMAAIGSLIKTESPEAVIFEDYNKGVLTRALIESVIAECTARRIFTAVDPKKKNFLSYRKATLFKPNLREVREALAVDLHSPDKKSLDAAHLKLKKKLQHGITLITLSEHGVYYAEGKNSGLLPAHHRNISDVSGAGDTVVAAITLALLSGLPLREAAEFANLAGGLVCEHPGVVPITCEMLLGEWESGL